MGEILQMLPTPGRRGSERARDEAIDRYIEDISRSSRQATPDRTVDRLVPQVFAAKITASFLQSPVSGRTWWEYEWLEVERSATGGTWVAVNFGRSSGRSGKAWNCYETTVNDDGGNIGPGTVSRLEYPIDSVVEMHIDPAGRAWFDKANPVEVICS
jgi:hypothetical protein